MYQGKDAQFQFALQTQRWPSLNMYVLAQGMGRSGFRFKRILTDYKKIIKSMSDKE